MYSNSPRHKFAVHKADAKRRGIPFLFSFDEWWEFWSKDDRWSNRGKAIGNFVMARFEDVGPYATWNVRCATVAENAADSRGEKRSRSTRLFHRKRAAEGLKPNLAVRGAGHPQSKAIITPAGRFESGALAADHFGITKEAIYNRVAKGWDGWFWERGQNGNKQTSGK